jgi:hypothetical protein
MNLQSIYALAHAQADVKSIQQRARKLSSRSKHVRKLQLVT